MLFVQITVYVSFDTFCEKSITVNKVTPFIRLLVSIFENTIHH